MSDSPTGTTETTRRTVYFSGHVQGVGFRYTTAAIARRYTVTGFVRNLPDGRVELVAEGTGDELDRFIAIVSEAMRANISGVDTTNDAPTGEFEQFRIRK